MWEFVILGFVIWVVLDVPIWLVVCGGMFGVALELCAKSCTRARPAPPPLRFRDVPPPRILLDELGQFHVVHR